MLLLFVFWAAAADVVVAVDVVVLVVVVGFVVDAVGVAVVAVCFGLQWLLLFFSLFCCCCLRCCWFCCCCRCFLVAADAGNLYKPLTDEFPERL